MRARWRRSAPRRVRTPCDCRIQADWTRGPPSVSVIVSLAKGTFGSQAGLPVACLLVSCRALMGRLHYTRVLAFSRAYARVV